MSRNYDYAPDEFDLREAGEVPVGVHRTPPPKWKAMLPFLLVIVIAAAVGIGGALYLSRGFGDEEPTATAPADPDETGEEPAPETPAAPCPWDGNLTVEDLACVEPAPEPVVDYSLTVRVLNNAGITGEAGRGRDGLIEAGFASASAGDFTGGDAPAATTVWYNPGHADTAHAVAAVLGIDPANVIEHAQADSDITVVLQSAIAWPAPAEEGAGDDAGEEAGEE